MPGQILIAAGGWHDDSPGGAYRLPSEFAHYLVKRGWRVAYLCPSRRGDNPNPEDCKGVELHRYSLPPASSLNAKNLFGHLHWSRSIAALIASRGTIHVLLGHSPLQYLGALSGCHALRKCYTVHSPFAAELRSGCSGRPTLRMRVAWALAERMEAYIYSKSDVVQCFSNYVLHELSRDFGRTLNGKNVVLPAWVDTGRFTPSDESAQQVRERLGAPWNSGYPTFVTVRRLVPRMGLDNLLEAAAILSAEGLAFRLMIAGDGPELQSLTNQRSAMSLEKHVFFLGRIPEERLVDVFRAGDCFVLPTRALEGFGLTILEAYACGTPVIAAPVGAISEVMGLSFQSWLADDTSAKAIAARMREFLMNRLVEDRKFLRHRALEFDLERVAGHHERVLLGRTDEATVGQALRGAFSA